MNLQESTLQAIREHAVAEYPRECCGLVAIVRGRERYLPCRNIATTPSEHFVLHGEDYAKAEELGSITTVVHSHPNLPARASEADRVACNKSKLPWVIVEVGMDGAGAFERIEPDGYEAPLVGRQFVHGVLDCFTLVRDYYMRHMNIELPEIPREDEWWKKGQTLYMDHYQQAGFEKIRDKIRVGDLILMQMRSPTPNHGAIYVGDGLILHHMYDRLSGHDLYDGYFQESTTMILRHKDAP